MHRPLSSFARQELCNTAKPTFSNLRNSGDHLNVLVDHSDEDVFDGHNGTIRRPGAGSIITVVVFKANSIRSSLFNHRGGMVTTNTSFCHYIL